MFLCLRSSILAWSHWHFILSLMRLLRHSLLLEIEIVSPSSIIGFFVAVQKINLTWFDCTGLLYAIFVTNIYSVNFPIYQSYLYNTYCNVYVVDGMAYSVL